MRQPAAGFFSRQALIFLLSKNGLRDNKGFHVGRVCDRRRDPAYHGEVTEWFKVHAWNACVREYREFESLLLRHF